MEYWVARDKGGLLCLFDIEPEWNGTLGRWTIINKYFGYDLTSGDFPELTKIKPGEKKQVELTIKVKE